MRLANKSGRLVPSATRVIAFISTSICAMQPAIVAKSPIRAVRILLLTEGPYHPAFINDNGNRNFGYQEVKNEYNWINLGFIMDDANLNWILKLLALSVLGLFKSPIFYSFHLLDMIYRFPALHNVLKSVTTNLQQIIIMGLFGLILIYIYSAIWF